MSITCFEQYTTQGFTVEGGFSPCGNLNTTTPSLPCCGGTDVCYTGGFCYHSYSANGESGYYVQGCTAGNVDDPNCLSRCVDLARPDVVFNTTTNLWHCCGVDASGTPQCGDPSDDTFAAPAPSALIPYFTITSGFTATSTSIISSSVSSGSSATSSSSSTTSVASHSTTPPKSSAGLSAGAAAGIGVGCGLAGIIMIVVAVIWFRRRAVRRMHSSEVTPMFNKQPDLSYVPTEPPQEVDARDSQLRAEIGPGK